MVLVDTHWYAGVLLELTGTLFNVLSKHAFRHAAVTGIWWWYLAGFAGWYLVYPALDILALNFASTSVVFAVDGMIVVWNIFLAPWTLSEPVTVARLTAAATITLGTIGAGAFGSHSEPEQTAESYFKAFSSDTAIAYFVSLPIVAVGIYLIRERYAKGTRKHGFWTGVLGGWFGGCGIFQKAALVFIKQDLSVTANALGLAAFSILAFVCLGIGVLIFAIGLRRHEALFLIPSYESVIVLQSALAGTLVNQDYRNRSWWEQTLYWFSIAIVIAGLSLLVVWPKWACNGEAEVAALNSCLLRERALNERSKLVKEGDAEQGRRDGCISRLGLGCCNGS